MWQYFSTRRSKTSFCSGKMPWLRYGEKNTRVEIILRASRSQVRYDDEDEDEGPQPDPMFEGGAAIPVRLHNEFPPELASTPLEDIDSFYHNQRVPGIDALISLTLLEKLSFRELQNIKAGSNERSLTMAASGVAILKLCFQVRNCFV